MASSGAPAWQLDAHRNMYYYDTPVEGGWQRNYQDARYSYFLPASPDYATDYTSSNAQDPRTTYQSSQTSLQEAAAYRTRTQSDASEQYGYTIDNLSTATSNLQLSPDRSTADYGKASEGRPYLPHAYSYTEDQRYPPSGHSVPREPSAQHPNWLQEYATPIGTTKQYLRGTDAEFRDRKLDSAFKRRKNGFFQVGKVFKVPWPEIAGNISAATGASDITYGTYGESVYTKIRWFVVVKTGNLSCSCLPIQTYGGKGASGVHLVRNHHAIIYTGNTPPEPDQAEAPRQGESPLGMPIRVNPKKATDKLDQKSRVNFSKIYPVEHNVKVYDFGQVHPQSEAWLLYQFKNVFDLSNLPSTAPPGEVDEESSGAESDGETSEAVENPEQAYYQGKGKAVLYD